MTWQPIATAPKDGTRVLLGHLSHKDLAIGFWSNWNRGWTTGEQDRWHDYKLLPWPSHWMPLPDPPEVQP